MDGKLCLYVPFLILKQLFDMQALVDMQALATVKNSRQPPTKNVPISIASSGTWIIWYS